MKPLLIVLDDWEGLIQKSDCWKQLNDLVEIKFLKEPIDKTVDSEIEQAEFLMALRERTALNKQVFKRMPKLKLILQTGGHAYHIDTTAAKQQNIQIALGRKVKAPLISVPELTSAFMLGLMHKVYEGNHIMHNGDWKLLAGMAPGSLKLLARHLTWKLLHGTEMKIILTITMTLKDYYSTSYWKPVML